MRAFELLNEDIKDLEKLTALGQFLIARANDKNATSELSVDAFISIANKMGIPLDLDSLQELVMKGEFQNVISDMNKERIKFKSEKQVADSGMPMDRAQNVVSQMAKRALKSRK